MVTAPGRMIDSFLSIPDTESLPLYRIVLKLACVCSRKNAWQLSIYPRRRIPVFVPYTIQASLRVSKEPSLSCPSNQRGIARLDNLHS
jgi:hypothetical protein